ncbi:hypothetical protein ACFX11_015177 [Malus domestica]
MSTINGEEEANSKYALQLANVSVLLMVLKAAIELGVLDIIHRAGAGALLSPSQIASQLQSLHNTNAPLVLDRMLRLLSAYSILTCSTIQANGKVIRVYGLEPVSKYFIHEKG